MTLFENFEGTQNYTNVQLVQTTIGSKLGQMDKSRVFKANNIWKVWVFSMIKKAFYFSNGIMFYFRWIFPVISHRMVIMSGISGYWEWVCSQILNNWSKSSTRRGFLKEENGALAIRSQLQPNHITIVDSQRIIFRTYVVTVVFFLTKQRFKEDSREWPILRKF